MRVNSPLKAFNAVAKVALLGLHNLIRRPELLVRVPTVYVALIADDLIVEVQFAYARFLEVLAAATLENHALFDALLLGLNVSSSLLASSCEAEKGD